MAGFSGAYLSSQGSTNRRIVQAGLRIEQDPFSKIANTKKGWWSGSSIRVPVS
jgi:hypothetical protein